MRTSVVTTPATCLRADAVIVPVYEDRKTFPPVTRQVDRAIGGAIRALLADEEIAGKLGQWSLLHPRGTIPAKRVLVVGMGNATDLDRDAIDHAAAVAARVLTGRNMLDLAMPLLARPRGALPVEAIASAMLTGAAVGSHGSNLYKADGKVRPIRSLRLLVDEDQLADARRGMNEGRILADAINLARDLVAEPAGVMTPVRVASVARRVARQCGLSCSVLDEKRLRAERMNALLAVSRGSHQPPRVVVLRYRGSKRKETLALVGKGVTFDSGGLDLKEPTGQVTMKGDMAGTAAVLGTMQAVARLKLPINVLAVVGGVENLPGGSAYKPGDVLTARNGKTIEIASTDAEGRLMLADMLAYAVDRKVDRLIDVATLTGVPVRTLVALAQSCAGG